MKSKRTKACEIPSVVKAIVWKRDNESCIFCGRWVPMSNACLHLVNRAHGGLGIETNIVTGCNECHAKLDNSTDRMKMMARAVDYMCEKYGHWNSAENTYRKEGT